MAKKPKLSRQEKKDLLKQQLAYEKQLVEAGSIPDRTRYQAHSIFWRVFACCLAFFFGIFTALGALVGGVLYYGTKKSVGDILGLVGVNYEQFLNEDYANMKLLDLVQDISKTDFNNLQSIGKYTPILRDTLDKANEQLGVLGVHLNIDELMQVNFSDVGTYFQETVVNGIVLGETLGLTPGNADQKLMIALCYGEEGEDYDVAEGKFVMREGKEALTVGAVVNGGVNSLLQRMTVESALGVTGSSNDTVLYLAYGTEGTHFEIKEDGSVEMLVNPYTGERFKKKTIADLMNDGATPLDDARISNLVTIEDDADGILGAIRDWKIADLKDSYRIERLNLGQLFTVDENSSALAKAIASWRIEDLTRGDKLSSVTLGEILAVTEDSPLILKALKDVGVGELGDRVNTLRLSDILGEEDIHGNRLLKSLGMSTLDSLSADILALAVADVFGDDIYDYLSLDESSPNGGKRYREVLAAFDPATENSAVLSPVEINDNERVNAYRILRSEPATRLTGGYVASTGNAYAIVESSLVYKKTVEEVVKYFISGEEKLTANRAWQKVDYASHGLVSLPSGDSVSSDPAGYVVEGTSEKGLYYLTARTLADETVQNVAYAIHEDKGGTYFTRLKHDSETDAYMSERVDLEYRVISYSDADGNVYNVQSDGTVLKDGESVTVYENKELDYFYLKTETEVFYRYYTAPAADVTEITDVYPEDMTEERYELIQTSPDGSESVVCELDRYLSNIWYLLFGGEDAEGNPVDNSQAPVLDIADDLGGLSDKLSNTELWKLYLHGILAKNPFVNLTSVFSNGVKVSDEKTVNNLNQCTLLESIELVKQLTNTVSPRPSSD